MSSPVLRDSSGASSRSHVEVRVPLLLSSVRYGPKDRTAQEQWHTRKRWCTRWMLLAVTLPALAVAPVAFGSGFDRAIESATQRVVKLYGLGAGLQVGYGTGIVVSEDRLVVTVLSLLIEARTIRVTDFRGRRYEAQVMHRDRATQLALLRLTPSGEPQGIDIAKQEEMAPTLPFFDLTRNVEVVPGDWVIAAGNAFKVAQGAEPVSIAHGVFSARIKLDARRRVKDFPYRGDVLVIDAITSNPGGPGSALVNLDGELLGMVGRLVTSNLTHTHFNYAIPRDVLAAFVRDAADPAIRSALARGKGRPDAVKRIDLGIRLARVGYKQVLPFVERVRRDSPAHRAGVRKDDLILSVNGRTVTDVREYDVRITSLSPDEPVDLIVRRGEHIVAIRVEPEDH